MLNLHAHRGSEEHNASDFVNPRIFVAAGCGTFQLVDKKGILSEHFHVGDDAIEFDSIDDLKKKIRYFLNHAEERVAIATKARRRVVKEHTYEARTNRVLALATKDAHLKHK